MRRLNSLEKTLMLGGIGVWRRRGWQRIRWLDGIADTMGMSLSKFQEWRASFMGSQRVGHDWATEMNWTELSWASLHCLQVIHFVFIELFISVSCISLYFCTVSCNVSFFISNLLILFFSLFILVTLTKCLWCAYHLKTPIFYFINLYNCFFYIIYFYSAHIFMISFLLLS